MPIFYNKLPGMSPLLKFPLSCSCSAGPIYVCDAAGIYNQVLY